MAERNPVLIEAIKKAGGPAAIAKAVGLSPQAVSQWEECPPKWVHALETMSKIPRSQIRPDIYPPDREAAA